MRKFMITAAAVLALAAPDRRPRRRLNRRLDEREHQGRNRLLRLRWEHQLPQAVRRLAPIGAAVPVSPARMRI